MNESAAAPEPFSLRSRALHVAIFAPALLWFSPVLFFGRVFYLRDTGLYFYPHAVMLAQALRAGRLPQWNPFEYGGVPLLADPNFNAFHPLALLEHLLPLPWGFSFFLFACSISAAYGARALARSLGISQAGSLAAGLFFAWSGPTLSLILSGQAVASCFIPWLCAAGARVPRNSIRRALLEVSIAGALVFCSGTPEVGACGFALAGLLAASEARLTFPSRGWRFALRAGALYLAGCVFAAALAAAQLLPTAAFFFVSARAGGIDVTHASTFALHPLRLFDLVLPFFSGTPDAPGVPSWIFGVREAAYVQELYAGFFVVVLALFGLRAKESRRRSILLVAALALLPLAMGPHLPIYPFLREHLPGLRNLRFPEKFAVPLSLALAVAAGAGWERLCAILERSAATPRDPARARVVAHEHKLLAGALVCLAASALALSPNLWGAALEAQLGPRAFQCFAATALTSAALELALAALFLLILRGHLQQRLSATATLRLAALLLVIELAIPAARIDQTVPQEELIDPAPLAGLLAADANAPLSSFRFTSQALGISAAAFDAIAGPDEPRTRTVFRLRRAQLLDANAALAGLHADRGQSGFTGGGLFELYTQAPPRELFELLGVRYGIEVGTGASLLRPLGWRPRQDLAREALSRSTALSARTPLFVYENPHAGPLAWLARGALRGKQPELLPRCGGALTPWVGEADASELPGGLTANSCAELAGAGEKNRTPIDGGANHETRSTSGASNNTRDADDRTRTARDLAEATRSSNEELELSIDAQAPRILVTAETALPGWRAFVDGAETPVVSAFGALRACAVPAGHHQVRFAYSAPGLRAGLWISLLALIAMVALAIFGRAPKKI